MSSRLQETDWFLVTVWAVALAVGVLLLGAMWDSVQGYRSFDARVACETQRMVPRRKPLEATVTCVPIPTRQDTTTINTPDLR